MGFEGSTSYVREKVRELFILCADLGTSQTGAGGARAVSLLSLNTLPGLASEPLSVVDLASISDTLGVCTSSFLCAYI